MSLLSLFITILVIIIISSIIISFLGEGREGKVKTRKTKKLSPKDPEAINDMISEEIDSESEDYSDYDEEDDPRFRRRLIGH